MLAIKFVFFQRGNDLVPFSETDGINVLGDIVESTILSPNRTLYGNLHNMGHNIISFIHDPDARFLVRKFLKVSYSYVVDLHLLKMFSGRAWCYVREHYSNERSSILQVA